MAEASLSNQAEIIRGIDDLLIPFHAAMKPRDRYRIGAEAEKFGVDTTTGAPLPYEGPRSVLTVLEALVERHGWKIDRESPTGPIIALERAGASVTLEPGGQLELSGAAFDNVHQICLEMSGHLAELRDISGELNLSWLGVGFHPLARQDELPWVPKSRYGIMRRYLPTRGTGGLDMMRRTATVQANFDYSSEEGAMRALRVSLRLSPVTTAMFANSPFVEGALWGGKSRRALTWLSVDPARQGLLENVLERGKRFVDYVEWALDAPMFLIKRGDAVLENTGQSFRSFLKHGFRDHRATSTDWQTHLNTLFPEVRLKRTIEVRGADSQSAALTCALPALWTGILYDDRALDEAEALTESFTYAELEALRPAIAEKGLGATFRGEKLAALAERVLVIAEGGLARRARMRNGKDERVHLARLGSLVEKGQCPADALVEGLEAGADLRREILVRARI
ncbi:glutamate-cysteine ligase family protein [Polyangium sp. y55x31]|uniref:glutamate--cysteine ligase n=1 Tax=Polyangium sp. y55x31 TaxID=3042688 RepID=UPI0024823D53|nr:glutamate-cysteine ligase family protein [Polyangium sp. y55x31]MDI1477697.1 glutamate-cysteine ligase family protein [Polyangium sp. y55x31]